MAEIMEYKCPACGGALEFNSSVQKMKCPYCDTEVDMESLKEYDAELEKNLQDDMTWDTMMGSEWQDGELESMGVYTCQSCGGEIVADENTAATSCPYCENQVVMTKRLSGDLRPDYVIPFKFDKKGAKEAYQNYLKGKRLMPNIFKDENHIDEIKGIYVPFWLFDAKADANIWYNGTKVRMWSSGDYNYTETSYYKILRAGSIEYERVPVDGSTRMEDELMESIEPYDFSEAVDFQTAYLAGYLADKYDVTAEESIERANERIRHSTEGAFESTIHGYQGVVAERSHISLNEGKAKYALYPVWILNTTWQGKKFTFAMNGQTGKFVGNLPVDKKAYWRWSLGLTAVCSILIYIIVTIGHYLF